MNYDMKKSGERIRQLRVQRELTQEDVAQMLNIDRSFYSRIEAGKSGCSVDLFVQFSELFHVSLDHLILGRYNVAVFKNTATLQLRDDIERLIDHLKEISENLG